MEPKSKRSLADGEGVTGIETEGTSEINIEIRFEMFYW